MNHNHNKNQQGLLGKWRIENLKEAMDTIERGFMSLREASRYWNIPLTSLLNHLTNKTKS
jgi:hypothetical protein